MDPRRSPVWVFPAHPSDKLTQAPIDLWPPCLLSRLPAPKRLEARAMPPQDSLRLNNLHRTKQPWPQSGHPDQQRPVTAAQSTTRRCTPQSDAKLMTKEQVLGLQPSARLEQVEEEHPEQVQDCTHRLRKRESQAGWNFRKGHPSKAENVRIDAAKAAIRYEAPAIAPVERRDPESEKGPARRDAQGLIHRPTNKMPNSILGELLFTSEGQDRCEDMDKRSVILRLHAITDTRLFGDGPWLTNRLDPLWIEFLLK
jgi:hypothetical protein